MDSVKKMALEHVEDTSSGQGSARSQHEDRVLGTRSETAKLKGTLELNDKLNGELKTGSKAGMNRGRSRSKSPRGKSPDLVKGKAAKEKKSPIRKTSPNKKKAESIVAESKTVTKRAAKRKAKDDSHETLENVNDTADDPKPTTKKPKKKPASVPKASASSSKPKKNCGKKGKKTDSIEVASPQKEEVSEVAGPSEGCMEAPDITVEDKGTLEILQNGEIPEQEAQVLNAQVAKKGCKKVSKKQQGPEAVVSTVTKSITNGPEPDTNLQNVGETDSDTVDYSVNGGGVCITDNLVEKKVVKIDDIEITELSDLNSSRESGDEVDTENLQIEKPQALNEVLSPPQPQASSETLANGSTSTEDKFFVCEQPNCLYRGKSRVLLRKHLTHHGIFNCAHCEFFGREYDALQQHMIANHPQRWGRKKCKKCMRYIRGAEFEGHEESCEGKKSFICEVCGKEFKYESLVLEHQKKNHQPFNCTLCEFVGDTKQILSHHVSQVHPKKKPDGHKCKQCDEKFPSKTKLSEHVKLLHGGGPVKKNTKVLTQDSTESITPVTLQTPVQTAFPSMTPNQAYGLMLSCVNNVQLGVVKPPESLQQGQSVPIHSIQNLPPQGIIVPGDNTEQPQTAVSSVNGQISPNLPVPPDELNASTNSTNKAENVATTGDLSSNSILDSSTSLMDVSKTEKDSSISDAPLPETVDMSEKSDPTLVDVQPLAHSTPQQAPIHGLVPIIPKKEERPFACTECPKRFKDQKTLNGHKNTHSKELNFVCNVEECKLAFKTARLLNFHKKTAHNMDKSVPMYPCEHPDCHLIFKKKGQMRKHEVVHTGERKYICAFEGCGKAFRHNANLKIHNLLHTGEKPIKCKHCDFACRQKSSLIHHMKTKHKDVEWPPKKEDQPYSQQLLQEPGTGMEEEGLGGVRKPENAEELDDSKSELDTSTEQMSESDISGNTSSEAPPQLTPTTTNLVAEPPAYPKMLSTPTKAMVKAMAPGFLLNTPGFEKSKPISPISATPSITSAAQTNADIYDFNDEDSDPSLQVSFSKKQQKSPGRPTSSGITNPELLQAMEPMNLSSEPKQVVEEVKVVKKKRSPRKKKGSIEKIEEKEETLPKVPPILAETISVKEEDDIKPQVLDVKPSSPKTEAPEEPKAEVKEAEEDIDANDTCSDDMVQDQVSENVPIPTGSSVESEVKQEESDMELGDPVAVPSQPEPYPDQLSQQAEFERPQLTEKLDYEKEIPEDEVTDANNERESDIPEEVENLALERGGPPSSGLLDIPSPEKRDSSNHDFDLPHDIDPDEAAKLLEGSDSFEDDPKAEGDHQEVSVIMSEDPANNKEDILSSPRSQHTDNMSHSHEQGSINPETFDFNSYGQQHHHHPPHHPGDFSEIHDLSSQKETTIPAEPESFNDPSQRRPSSSYVPDFLPTMPSTSAGSSGLGPPSVSSSYSSPSYTQAPPSQSDLSNYGAPGSNLPPYTPQSTGVPYMSPTSTPASYPITTSAGISSYPPVTSSYTNSQPTERTPSVGDSRAATYQGPENTAVTSSAAYANSPSYQSSRELFGHYFQDPLSQLTASQDPRSLPYSAQQSSLQALQRSSADFLQRASATGLPGMNYPSVTESLARLSQTTTQQPWISSHADERSRPWAQPSPILMGSDLESASPLASRNPFSSSRPEFSGLEAATKRPDSAFPTVPPQTVPSATERYDVASAYMGSAGHFNPSSNYSKSLTPSVAPDAKQLEEAYRHSAAHMGDYRSLSQGPPHVTDMYSRMGMNPPLGLDKYYPYSRDAVYRSQHIGSTTNPFMPPVSTSQVPYPERDYAARNPYSQDSAYSKYLPAPANLTQPLPGLQGAAGDYLQPRTGAPDPYDPYRRSVIHNMMTRYF